MHKLSRTSLAAIVCPSAPFLAPRLLRTVVPNALYAAQCTPWTQKSCYATRPKRTKSPGQIRWERQNKAARESGQYVGVAEDTVTPLLEQLRTACETRNVDQMMDLYPNLRDLKALGRLETRQIAQALHTRIRHKSQAAELLPFVQQFVADIRSGALEPHPYAFVHLLGIYKSYKRFDEGRELWQWLVQQDETYVSQAAYGAAIELLAYGGLSTLPELEQLYTEGLKRFPGTFAEYHLSPDAIVPDRSQPTFTLGIPTLLVQGISSARLLARDWKRAYVSLDTVLRLYPTQTPAHFFELFMAERPVAEAYTAFTVACRAGVVLNPKQLTALLTKLKSAMPTRPAMQDRVMLLRATANALYAYQEAGGQLQSLHVGVFLHCFENLLPELQPGQDYQGESAALRNDIVVTAHAILAGLFQAGLSAEIHTFEALMSLAGKLRVPDLLTTTFGDITKAQIPLGPIGIRSALTSAGLVKHQPIIEQLWTGIAAKAESEGSQIASEAWITFAKACRRTGIVDYFHQQLSELSHTTTSALEEHLRQQMGFGEKFASQEDFYAMPLDELTSEMDGLKQQMKNVEAVLMSGTPLDLRASPFHMHLDADTTSLSSLLVLRTVYDELTTDPHQPAPPHTSAAKPVSPTGIPLDELRFMNWLSILEMMDDAEEYEARFQLVLSQAIGAGKPFDPANVESLRARQSKPLADRDALRERVRVLRNPNAVELPAFRRISSKVPDEKFRKMEYEADGDKWMRMKIKKFGTDRARVRKFNVAGDAASEGEEFAASPQEHAAISQKPTWPPEEQENTEQIHSTPSQPQPVSKERKPRRELRPVEIKMAEEEAQRYGHTPALRYYVGMESHHDAPMNPKVRRVVVQDEERGKAGKEVEEREWPSVEELTAEGEKT
jgi:hypothetical protein